MLVARAHRQPVCLAHGRHRHKVNRKIEVGHHAPERSRAVARLSRRSTRACGCDDVEQLQARRWRRRGNGRAGAARTDDPPAGRHPQCSEASCGYISAVRRSKHEVHAIARSQIADRSSSGRGYAGEIVSAIELQWVDEEADHDMAHLVPGSSISLACPACKAPIVGTRPSRCRRLASRRAVPDDPRWTPRPRHLSCAGGYRWRGREEASGADVLDICPRAASTIVAERFAYGFTNDGTKRSNRPSMSWLTRICPSQSGPAPMPIVGTSSCDVMRRGQLRRDHFQNHREGPRFLKRVRVHRSGHPAPLGLFRVCRSRPSDERIAAAARDAPSPECPHRPAAARRRARRGRLRA